MTLLDDVDAAISDLDASTAAGFDIAALYKRASALAERAVSLLESTPLARDTEHTAIVALRTDLDALTLKARTP